MEFIKRLITGRAALIALVGACLVAARRFGFILPEGSEDAVSKILDTAISFLGFMVVGSSLHNANAPESK